MPKRMPRLLCSEHLRQEALGGARVLLELFTDLKQQQDALLNEVTCLRSREAVRDTELVRKSSALMTIAGELAVLGADLTAAREAAVAKDWELQRRQRGILGWARRAERAEGEVAQLREAAVEGEAELGCRAARIEALEARCLAAEDEVRRRREAGAEVILYPLPPSPA